MSNFKVYKNVNEILYEKLKGNIDWNGITKSKLAEDVIFTFQKELFSSKVSIYHLIHSNYIPIELVIKYINKIDLYQLLNKNPLKYNCYDMEFILKVKNQNQKCFIKNRKIEEDLLDKYKDSTLQWMEVSEFQSLTQEQLIKYAKYLKWGRLIKNKYLDINLLFELKEILPFKGK